MSLTPVFNCLRFSLSFFSLRNVVYAWAVAESSTKDGGRETVGIRSPGSAIPHLNADNSTDYLGNGPDDLLDHSDEKSISLSLISNDVVIKQIRTCALSRGELKRKLNSQRQANRDLSVYFSCIMDVFSMTSQFLHLCGAMLPARYLMPFTFNFQVICKEIIRETLKLADQKKFLVTVPSSLQHMRRISNAVVQPDEIRFVRFSSFYSVIDATSGSISFQKGNKSTNNRFQCSNYDNSLKYNFFLQERKMRGCNSLRYI